MPRSPKTLVSTHGLGGSGLQLNDYTDKRVFDRTPKIRFPSLRGERLLCRDREAIPPIDQIVSRYRHNKKNSSGRLSSEKFYRSLRPVQQVLIFDPYFDRPDMETLRDCILGECHNLSYLYIITGVIKNEGDFSGVSEPLEDLKREFAKKKQNGNFSFRVLHALQKGFSPYPHDRFALLDGEFWHFGATVGGGHPGLNAYSRGWSDKDVKFSKFFKDAWDDLSQLNRAGGRVR